VVIIVYGCANNGAENTAQTHQEEKMHK